MTRDARSSSPTATALQLAVLVGVVAVSMSRGRMSDFWYPFIISLVVFTSLKLFGERSDEEQRDSATTVNNTDDAAFVPPSGDRAPRSKLSQDSKPKPMP